jgi:hypothetical protein
MRPPKTTVILAVLLCCSLKTICQVTQDCTYGAQLNKVNHFLDSSTASRWIDHYQQYVDSVRKGLAKFEVNIFPDLQESFNRRYIQKILDVTGCVGERVFIGMNDDEKMVVMLGGIDSCGNTLYITGNAQQILRMDNRKGSNAQTSNSGDDKGLVELGQFP